MIVIKKYVGTRVAKPAKKQKKKSGAGRTVATGLTAFFVTILLLSAAILTFGFTLKYGTTVYPNVTVFGVNVGGMTLGEATDKVQTETDKAYAQPLRIALPDKTVELAPEKTCVSLNVTEAVEEALSYGRDVGPLSALFTWLDCRNSVHHIDPERSLTFDDAYVKQVVKQAVSEAEIPMVPSSAVYDEEYGVINVSIGTPGQSLDYDSTYEAVVNALSCGDFEEITMAYDRQMYGALDLSGIYKEHAIPVQDAYYDTETRSLAPEVVGFGFDLEAQQQRVNQAASGESFTVQFNAIRPEVYLEDLEELYFRDVLASYSSPHSTYNPGRTENLRIACSAINRTLLNPGEEFSFNNVVGERTAAKGYQPATIYAEGGASEEQLGGGVCQVASTIYLTALLADLDITERYAHMYAVDYVPLGLDATIYWGSLDFRFRNSTDYPMIINATVENGYVNITFIGTKTSDITVQMTSEILSTDPWTQTTLEDPSLAPGMTWVYQTAYTGYKVQSWKHYYDGQGTLIDTRQCAFSQYTRRDRIVYVGPSIDPPAPEPAANELPQQPAVAPVANTPA